MKQQIDVLIIEDNLIDQKLLSTYLEEYDITYLISDSGEDARKMLESAIFKLLLLDISLPGIDGYELTKIIRQEMNIDTPIVAVTTYSVEEVKDKCFAAGMDGCFSKPIGKVELVGILTQFLPKEKLTSNGCQNFEVIDLSYLKEISLNDPDYELEIVQKFITTIESDIAELKEIHNANNRKKLSGVAHRTLSTIYVMGLKTKLESTLRAIEKDDLNDEELAFKLNFLYDVCEKAKVEAQDFIENFAI